MMIRPISTLFTLITTTGLLMPQLVGCSSSPVVDKDDATREPDPTSTTAGTSQRDGGTTGGGVITLPSGSQGTNSEPPPCEADAGECYVAYDAGPACGDGVVDVGEDCDDGNSAAGDGCNGACKVEPFYDCGEDGLTCVFTIVCGDGQLDPGEWCDDNNTEDNDGCNATCTEQDPSFICLPGKECERLYECGDSRVNGSDECDDGNNDNGDGCDADCKLEEGYRCPTPGQECVQQIVCGNLKRESGEQCDDGNTAGGDGCAENCRLEKDWACNAAGECRYTPECGDGKVSGEEICDDGNAVSGDGCSDECQVKDEGYVCERPGFSCRSVCGDGILAGSEQCDDGNTDPDEDGEAADGCSARCRVEPNTVCTNEPGEASVCEATTCGDGEKEGTEPCDDDNLSWGDGCTPECQIEPSCAVGAACASECGDGIKFPTEACDDGNTQNGDGCSDACVIEEGFECEEAEGGDTIVMPMVVRDFVGANTAGGNINSASTDTGITSRHLDFQWAAGSPWGLVYGLVDETLGANKKPVFAYTGAATSAGTVGDCPQAYGTQQRGNPAVNYCARFVQNAASFELWYTDDDAYNNTYQQQLTLRRTGGDTFVYDSEVTAADGTDYPAGAGPKGFWPLENATGVTKFDQCGTNPPDRNFHFTSEVHHWFQYDSSQEATLTFTGDDDVFVFIAGTLVLDLGGIHAVAEGSVTLTTEGNAVQVRPNQTVNVELNLENGKIYEIIVFQAERNTCESNYRLELENFNLAKSVCTPVCGDGVVTADEECDDGENNTDEPEYGKCTVECKLGPFCGDGAATDDEACDNGINTSIWGDDDDDACAPGCVLPPVCGDGNIDADYEVCDDGEDNVESGYGGCTDACTPGSFCGDGTKDVDDGETCDDGVNDGTYGSCTPECAPGPRCGDGETQEDWGEQCDGEENCSDTCRLGAQCGDGRVQKELGEQCDDGKNTGAYGECGPMCLLGPRCGDGVVQKGEEQCDDGANDGGYGECAPGCNLGPRCGDKVVQEEFGETCDDGNSKAKDGCSPTCRQERRDIL